MNRNLIIGISLLISLAVGIILIWPKYQNFQDIRLKIKERKIELQYRAEYFADIQRTFQELEGYKASLSRIDSALPQSPSIPALFDFLQKESSQSGLILKGISLVSVTSPEGQLMKEIKVRLSLSGSYSSLKNFLAGLHDSARLIEIENLSINFTSVKEKLLNLDLLIKTYSY